MSGKKAKNEKVQTRNALKASPNNAFQFRKSILHKHLLWWEIIWIFEQISVTCKSAQLSGTRVGNKKHFRWGSSSLAEIGWLKFNKKFRNKTRRSSQYQSKWCNDEPRLNSSRQQARWMTTNEKLWYISVVLKPCDSSLCFRHLTHHQFPFSVSPRSCT